MRIQKVLRGADGVWDAKDWGALRMLTARCVRSPGAQKSYKEQLLLAGMVESLESEDAEDSEDSGWDRGRLDAEGGIDTEP